MKYLKLSILFDDGSQINMKGNDIVSVLPIRMLQAMRADIDSKIKEKEVITVAKATKKVVKKPAKKAIKK